MRKRLFVAALAAVILLVVAAHIPTSIRVGVDGRYRTITMPLYVKGIEFLARHYEYERLAREITAGRRTDEEKALAVLDWTKSHMKDVPAGMPVYDDHVLYTIVRGYGVPEQFQDVFTILCSYAGVPAYYAKLHDKAGKEKYAISLVKVDGTWRIFDAYLGIYFTNGQGQIASMDEIVDDPSLVIGDEQYRDFFYSLHAAVKPSIARPDRQKPSQRILYEIRKLLNLKNS